VAVADVTVDDQVRDAVATAISRFGRLDLAFNVAGAARFGSILDGAVEDWSATVDLLLKGTYLGTRHAALAMREGDRGGAIVNVASLNAHVPLWGASSYAAGKAARRTSQGRRAGAGPVRVRVNAVLPGLVETPLTAPLLAIPGLREDYLRRIPRPGRRIRTTSPVRACTWPATTPATSPAPAWWSTAAGRSPTTRT